MTRSTSTQRGASRRSAGTADQKSRARSSASSRARSPKNPPRATRARTTAPARAPRRFPRPLTPVIVLGLVVVLAWVLYPAMRLEYQASREKAAQLRQLEQMKQANAEARADVEDLQTPEGVERSAREDLGYAKDGENVYVVIPPSVETSGPEDLPVSSASAAASRSALDVILDALFGVDVPSTSVEP